ncbi:MAG TPA: 3D domain-containing protein [Pyrinomonadaceae bacterium]|jgi:3D (Asp-Asp-Asp) domain-containing protein
MKSLYGGSVVTAAALIALSLFTYASPLIAEANPFQEPTQEQKREHSKAIPSRSSSPSTNLLAASEPTITGATLTGKVVDVAEASTTTEIIETLPAAPIQTYMATAYCLRGRTASGKMVARGLIAADPSVLPLGSRVRLDAGSYSGEYLVADTGGAVRGRHIDIWTASAREAMTFGRRSVKLTVLSYGAARRALRRKARS